MREVCRSTAAGAALRRTLAMAVKEMLHLRRDPRTTLTLLVMPVILLLLYGFVLSFDVRHIRFAVVDEDGSAAARDLQDAFLQSGYFDLVSHERHGRAVDRGFDTGEVQAALVVPAGYGAALAAGRPTSVQFVLDGSDARLATTILAYGRQIAGSVTPVLRGGEGVVLPQPYVWYNPELTSARFLVPGLVAFILAITTAVATAMSVAREKERGTLESLRVTPLGALELLVGKTLPYLVLASFSASLALALAWGLFDVPMRGSLLALALLTVLFLGGGLGWGLFVSTVADTQQVAFQIGLLSTMLPTLLLSGFVFPISSMPVALQWITRMVPPRYYVAALREIVLKGAGIEVWGSDAAALAGFGILTLGLGAARLVRSL